MARLRLTARPLILLIPILVSCRPPEVASELDIADDSTAPTASSRIDRAEDLRTYSDDLAAFAEDGDFEVRARLALALGRIGDPRAVPTLLALLGDREALVRERAAFALGLFGDEAGGSAVDALLASLENEVDRDTALDALGRTATAAEVPRIASFLDSADARERAAAARALGLLGQRKIAFDEPSASKLAHALSDAEEPVRFMAAFALFRGGISASPAAATTALRNAAKGDTSFEVRAISLRALAKGDALDDTTLENAMLDSDDGVAATAMMALSNLEAERRCKAAEKALEVVAARLEKDAGCLLGTCAHVVRAALEQSPSCADIAEVARLADRIETAAARAPKEVSAGAARVRCLARLVGKKGDLALIACDPERPYAGKRLVVQRLTALEKKTDENIAALVSFAAEPDLRVAAPALEALAATGSAQGRGSVSRALESPVLSIVGAALDAIATAPEGFRDDETFEKFAGTIERFRATDNGHAPLLSAAAALAALGGEKAAGLLAELAADTRPEVRNAALLALDGIENAKRPGTLPPIAPPRPASHVKKPAWTGKRITATITTTRGDLTILFRPELAPATVESFVELARRDFFDGTEIHRVVPNFVVQMGDPTGSGLGDAGYALRCEVTDAPYVRGTVGMALSGKDTGGSQFFVALSRQPHLDANYTVFGEVTSGMDVLDVIEEGDAISDVEIDEGGE